MTSTKFNIPLEKITTYLKGDGWHVVNNSGPWCVFEGQEDVQGDPFEIVLPQKDSSPEYPIYVMHMVEILSSLADKTQELIVQEIDNVYRDVLLVRVDDSTGATSIPFNLAAKQISNLKQLVAYAACSEKTLKTHYRDSSQGKAMAEHYRFGHTVSGSFGYRVESDVGEKILLHEDTAQLRQLDIFADQEIDEVPPLERRVLERIVRGLAATAAAADADDITPLIDGYISGFNANMCLALLQISKGHEEPIEYNVSWSKKYPVSDDVAECTGIRIDHTHFDYLDAASSQLKKRKAEKVRIEGLVTALSSDDDPRDDDVDDRSAIIRITSGRHKSRKIRLALGKRDYERADKAHMAWNTIAVTGVMQRIGSRWHLSDPHDFRVIR